MDRMIYNCQQNLEDILHSLFMPLKNIYRWCPVTLNRFGTDCVKVRLSRFGYLWTAFWYWVYFLLSRICASKSCYATNSPAVVGLSAFLLPFCYQIDQPWVFCRFSLTFSPGLLSAAGYPEDMAHGLYGIVIAKFINDPIFQLHLLDRKFRSSSTCIFRRVVILSLISASVCGVLQGRPMGCGIYPLSMNRAFRFCRLIFSRAWIPAKRKEEAKRGVPQPLHPVYSGKHSLSDYGGGCCQSSGGKRSYLYRILMEELHCPAHDYVMHCKIERAKEMMGQNQCTLTEIDCSLAATDRLLPRPLKKSWENRPPGTVHIICNGGRFPRRVRYFKTSSSSSRRWRICLISNSTECLSMPL